MSNPRTADGDAFRFRAGRPSLDLCSTLLWRHRTPTELLRRPGDLARWLVEAGLASAHPRVTEADLARAGSLREASYRLLLARALGTELPADAVAKVNVSASRPGRVPRLRPSGHVDWLTGEPVAAALSEVARDCVSLLTGPLAPRIRECAAPDCAFLFVDTSRPGSRRWCAADRCGNRQHVRAHRARRAPSAARQ